ncbi:MAG: peptide deformylase [Ruminococcaceae bacterium]|nr:peptide deformylase [Oscillospiraceae bacterium]
MAIRNIRKLGDDLLRKKSREVEVIDERILTLLDDMTETMNAANGVGLAAPQVGILKRVVVIDVGEGPIELINPEIINLSGHQTSVEGCLSVPDRWGEVVRPKKVVVRAQDRNGDYFEVMGEDLLATALCHELDHLDGVIFVDKATRFVNPHEDDE